MAKPLNRLLERLRGGDKRPSIHFPARPHAISDLQGRARALGNELRQAARSGDVQGLFAPAIRLLNQRRYGAKFGLLGALALATIGFYVATLNIAMRSEIQASRTERAALPLHANAVAALLQVEHHSLVAQAAAQDSTLAPTLASQAAAVSRLLDAVDSALKRDNDRFGLAPRWAQVRSSWQAANSGPADQRAEAQAQFRRQVQDFIGDLGEASGLLSDSSRNANLLANLLIRKLPDTGARLGALNESSVLLLSTREMGAEWTRMAALMTRARNAQADLLDTLQRAASANPEHAATLNGLASTLEQQINDSLSVIDSEVLRGAFGLAPGEFVNQASALQQTLHQAHAPIAASLDALLAARTEALESRFWSSSLLGAILVAVLFYFGAALVLSILDGVARLAEGAARIGEGELAHRIDYPARDELEGVANQFNRMAAGLAATLGQVKTSAEALHSAAERLAAAADQVAEGSERQSESAASMAAAVEEMTVGVEEIARNAGAADTAARESGELSDAGGKVVDHAVSEMELIAQSVNQSAAVITELGQNSARISSIVQSIKDIAGQTNLLALNAAIEAARAGEEGRGFAVVADEVRKLAERTTSATQQIASMVDAIQAGTSRAVQAMRGGVQRVEEGLVLTRQSGTAMGSIRSESERVLHSVSEISQALREQTSASTDIARNVEAIAQMAEENNAVVGQTRSTARGLVGLAEQLGVAVRRFRL